MIWAALHAAMFVAVPAALGLLEQPAGDRQPNGAGREADRAAVHATGVTHDAG